ncbi:MULTISPECIES: hypothetical protein [Bhargavaea]|uniref:Uncharacterized protein n=1 Tax=Bhargavaea changchunensis TaxID=2134037 RepID=A0ABW2NC96_9BACL|nr:hypothetical protein [Bhargavaea sp. CC-171006]
MLKTMKSKVAAGTAAVLLVGGGGVAFGASDAGAKLSNWYKGQFTNTSVEIANETGAYGKGAAEDAWAEYNTIKSGAGQDILNAGTASSDAASAKIETAADEHVDALKTEYSRIAGYMDSQFLALENASKFLIQNAGKAAQNQALADLKKHSDAKGQEALDALNAHLEQTTTTAVGEVDETIKYVKGDLAAKLQENKDASVEEIKGMIDAEIERLRGVVNTRKDQLVTAQKDAIQAQADLLEGDAKQQMQNLVNGI